MAAKYKLNTFLEKQTSNYNIFVPAKYRWFVVDDQVKYPCKQQIANKLLSEVYKHRRFRGQALNWSSINHVEC